MTAGPPPKMSNLEAAVEAVVRRIVAEQLAPLEKRVAELEAAARPCDETAISKKLAAAILGVSRRELERRMQSPSVEFARCYFREAGRHVKFIRRRLLAYRDGQV